MNISRRSFLRSGSMMGLATIVTGGLGAAAFGQDVHRRGKKSPMGEFSIPKSANSDPLANITRTMWTEAMNTKFTFSQKGIWLTEMTLIAVNDLNPPFVKVPPTSTRECYSLVFTDPGHNPLKQDTYSISNYKLGNFLLFIVPASDSATGSGNHYEANINRAFP